MNIWKYGYIFIACIGLSFFTDPIFAQCVEGWTYHGDGKIPIPCYGGAIAYDSLRSKFIMFGGQGKQDGIEDLIQDTIIFDGYRWSSAIFGGAISPLPRMYNKMIYDSNNDLFVMFSGLNYEHAFNDLWEFNPSSKTWKQVFQIGAIPNPRWWPATCYDSTRSLVVMFGGSLGYGIEDFQSNELWELNRNRWYHRSISFGEIPAKRTFAAMAYDSDRRVSVMHGGYRMIDSQILSDTWTWDGEQWHFVCYGPALRFHAMTYDAARHVVVAIPSEFDKTERSMFSWEFDGTKWTKITNSAFKPIPRNRAQICYGENETVMVGGYMIDMEFGADTIYYDDMLSWKGPSRIDFNHDGFVDFSDYLEFLSLYDTSSYIVDLNDDGFIDFSDWLMFIDDYSKC